MKKKVTIALAALLFTVQFSIPAVRSQDKAIPLYEEDRAYWKDLMNDATVINRNLFYAGFVAYKERLSDLSIESFKESLSVNPSHGAIRGVSFYYIGKNYFLQGRYADAIEQFSMLKAIDLAACGFIKHCAVINAAVSYYRMKNTDKCREYLQTVISGDADKTYKSAALNILKAIQ